MESIQNACLRRACEFMDEVDLSPFERTLHMCMATSKHVQMTFDK